MKKITKWFIVSLIICAIGMVSCNNKEEISSEVESIELLRTSQSWNEVELPDYPQGRPELVAVKYVIPAGKCQVERGDKANLNHLGVTQIVQAKQIGTRLLKC